MFDWYWYFVYYLIAFHVSYTAYTLYEHRALYHGHFIIAKPLEYVLRIILWLIMYPWPGSRKFLAAQHRYHHKTADTPDDPNSPYFRSFTKMFDVFPNIPGKTGYMSPENIEKHAKNVQDPDDWLERNITGKHWKLGIWVHIAIVGILFGPIGAILGTIFSFGTRRYGSIFIGNYLFHKCPWGYIADDHDLGPDRAINLFPIGILISGEGLHRNHHVNPASPKFSRKWWEFDAGWMYARIFMFFGLIKLTDHAKRALTDLDK